MGTGLPPPLDDDDDHPADVLGLSGFALPPLPDSTERVGPSREPRGCAFWMLLTAVLFAVAGGIAFFIGSRGGCDPIGGCGLVTGIGTPPCRPCQPWEGFLQFAGMVLIPAAIAAFLIGLWVRSRPDLD